MQEQDNKRQDRTRKPRFPDRCPPVRKKRLILILLPLFLLILLLLYYKAGNHKEPVRPVVLDSKPVGMIWPDSDNGNRNTAQASFSIKNPSSKTQSVTFQITYDLLLSEKHFTFDIEHLYVKDEEGTFRELPDTVMEIPGNTTLSVRVTAVDHESAMELTTRGAPEVRIIFPNTESSGELPEDYTTDTRSTVFQDRDEKLAFLSRYLEMPSEMIDAAYHIVYQDNSKGRVPGPSDYDIRAAFTVEANDLSLWTKDMKKILPEQVDPGWWEDLKTSGFTWDIPSDAEYYKRPGSESYIVICPDLHLILKMVSSLSLPLSLEDSASREEFPEELPGYDQFKTLAADTLGYDHSAVPYIRTAMTEKVHAADGTELTLICYRAMFCNSPLYGIPVLVISGDGGTSCTVLCDGSYGDEWYLADIDGDSQDELLMHHLISITGGAGAYESDIYRISDGSPAKIFGSPEWDGDNYFDTYFTLHLSEGYTHTVQNGSTVFYTTFTRKGPEGNPYFDADGNLTDEGRENNETDWLSADPYFYLFTPVDADGDGVFEIMTAQYTYLYGRSDGLGAAYTLLKWDSSMERMYIMKAGFWPYEDHEEDDQEYTGRWEEYENTWYKKDQPDPGDLLDSRALIKAASDQIRAIDFHVRQFPINDSLYDAATDKIYREAFYKAVTNQKPVLCRAYRSLDYEEDTYQNILRSEYLSDQEFLRQELKQDSSYYYTDYDGDGLPELIVRNMGLYGLKYDPEQDQVYLFLSLYSSYGYFMGAGQIFWHNPCLASKDMYSYESEDRNGNRVFAGFKTVFHWDDDVGSSESYYISTTDYSDVEVSQKLWEELFSLLQEARSETPEPETYEEFFKDFYKE